MAFTTTIRLRDTGGYSGTAGGIKYGYDESGKPIINKEPRLMLDNHGAGKPEVIHLMIGRLPDTKVDTFSQALYDAGKKNGWTVISIKTDWKRIFSFEK